MKDHYEIAIIGAGPGGVTAAIEAAKRGLSVALIEKAYVGGVYLHEGCISVKSLAISEKRYRQFLKGMDFGIYPKSIELRVSDWMNRQRNVSSKIHLDLRIKLEQYPKIRLVMGNARFLDRDLLEVQTAQKTFSISAKKIIIATGASPVSLPQTTIDGPKIGTSQHYVHRPKIPQSLTIIGGGYIGCEFAGIYATLGTQVTLAESADYLLPQMQKEAGEFLAQKYRGRGIKVLLGERATGARIDKYGDCQVEFISGKQLRSENVLIAVGREAQVEGLNLDQIGVQYDRSILVDETLQTTVPGIYAIGDVNGLNPLAHSAIAQARALVQRFVHEPELIDFRQIPFCVYTDPEITCVGYSEELARKAGFQTVQVTIPFSQISRSISQGESEGFLSLVADQKTKRILGGLLIGNEAVELISILCLALRMNATAYHLASTIIPHPSYAEIFQNAALKIVELGQS